MTTAPINIRIYISTCGVFGTKSLLTTFYATVRVT